MKPTLIRIFSSIHGLFIATSSLRTRAQAAWLVFTLLTVMESGARAEESSFDSNGVKIHYRVEGRGDTVILVHGLLVNATINWGLPGIISALATNHQVIALDCRGHGTSGKPTNEDDYGVKMVDAVVRLMDHLGVTNADVVGYSMGGMITMKLMVLHPERVRRAVLGGMGWMEDGRNLFPGIQEGSPKNATEACILGFKGLAVSAADVRGIKTPFIVIVGADDPLKAKFVEPLEKIRPDVPVKIVAGADHLSCVGKSQFLEDITTYLNGPLK